MNCFESVENVKKVGYPRGDAVDMVLPGEVVSDSDPEECTAIHPRDAAISYSQIQVHQGFLLVSMCITWHFCALTTMVFSRVQVWRSRVAFRILLVLTSSSGQAS